MVTNPAAYSLWHRRDHRPRPVLVVQELPQKLRVVDLVESTPHHLILRDVSRRNITRRDHDA